ncbi:MAG: type II toxin-antitoxin system VapC family toxin [Candidatus Woesearchaeota archaeon]
MICLDSSFVIDYFKGDKDANKMIKKLDFETVFLTEISVFEISVGMINTNKKNLDMLLRFLDKIKIIPTTTMFSLEAARIKKELELKGMAIDSMDLLIAGMMRSYGFSKILTRNKKYFEKIDGLEVISY